MFRAQALCQRDIETFQNKNRNKNKIIVIIYLIFRFILTKVLRTKRQILLSVSPEHQPINISIVKAYMTFLQRGCARELFYDFHCCFFPNQKCLNAARHCGCEVTQFLYTVLTPFPIKTKRTRTFLGSCATNSSIFAR